MEMNDWEEVDSMCSMADRMVNKGIEQERKRASVIIKEKDNQILEQANQISQKEEQIKYKEEQITEQKFIIEELRKQLAIYQKQ